MLGALLGDIVGSPYEFDHNNYKHKDFPLLSEKSHFTDDTVMTAAVQNENKLGKIFLHNNALRFVVYRFRWQKDTTNRRAKGQRAGDKSRTQLFLIVFKQ